jgi:hypothetical protein
VSYGIDNASLTVWVDNRAILEREHAGRLCRRHADALVVPRGWTLDDRRLAVPQLFRVVESEPEKKSASRGDTSVKRAPKREKKDDGPSLFETIEAELEEIEKAKVIDPDETQAIPWSPRLVTSDDANDDDDQPVYGRLLGRAFGKKNPE